MVKLNQLKLKYLDEPKKALKFWMFLAFFDFVVFGFLGLQLSLSTYSEKKVQLKEIKDNIELLQNKKFVLVDTEANLNSVAAALPGLFLAIPDSPDFQNYLLQLITVAANNGFVISEFNSTISSDNTEGTLKLEISGNRDNISNIISEIEKFPRITSINSLDLDLKEPSAKMYITMKVYFSNDQALDLLQLPDAKIDQEFLNKEFLPAHE
jgi:Tfp pilus assembly protein PilO